MLPTITQSPNLSIFQLPNYPAHIKAMSRLLGPSPDAEEINPTDIQRGEIKWDRGKSAETLGVV